METIIIVLVIVAVILIPFLINHNLQKRKKMKFISHFTDLASRNNATITRQDFWKGSYAIGIDENSKKVLYQRRTRGKEEELAIDLKDIAVCSVSTEGNSVNTHVGNSYSASWVRLLLTGTTQGSSQKTIVFFDGTEAMSLLDEELPLAEKWSSIINSNLTSVKR
jgi:hypothetical protein